MKTTSKLINYNHLLHYQLMFWKGNHNLAFVLMGSLILAFILLILLINNKQQFKLING